MKVKCDFCGEEMQLEEGTVIYGEKWYHADCAKKTISNLNK